MKNVLDNIRVLDITRYVAGPVCAAQLADLGADVIHVENVGGAEDRTPLPVDQNYYGGAGFIQVNRNKKGLGLDLTSEGGQKILHQLLQNTDIVVANMPQKAMLSLGIDYESLRAVKPDVILAHITTFGNEGPYANRTGFDAIAQVMSGAAYLSGWEKEPMKNAAAWVDMTTGNHATTGILAALLYRNATGKGQKVEVNLLQSAMTVTNYFLLEERLTEMGRAGIGNRAPSGGPCDLILTSDGGVYIAVLGNPMFKRMTKLLGKPELFEDSRFLSDELRAENGVILSDMVAAWAGDKTSSEALETLAEFRIPAGPLYTPKQILEDEHVLATGILQEVDVPGLSKPVPYVTPPYRMSESPATIQKGPPLPGEHTNEILAELGYSTEQIETLKSENIV